MGSPMFLTFVVLSGVMVGVMIGVFIAVFWHDWHSKRFRTAYNIPDVIGTWRCKWFDDAQSQEQPKIEDTVEIQSWTTEGQFSGGRAPTAVSSLVSDYGRNYPRAS